MKDPKEIIKEKAEKLDKMFEELAYDLKEDLDEANANIEQYHQLVDDNPDGKALFGTLYNDSLKIKGSIRERQLKLLNSYKERVAKLESDIAKENQNNKDEAGFEVDHSALSQTLKEMAKEGNIKRMQYKVPKVNFEESDGEELEIDPPKNNEEEDDDE